MIYVKCPSCSTVIGNRQIIYENGLEEINSDPTTTNELKLQLKTKLIESLNIKNYCCKMRVISYIQLTNVLK